MQSDGRDAALRSAPVRKYAEVGGREQAGDLFIVDVSVQHVDTAGTAGGVDLRLVFLETAVAFAGDDELVAVSEQRQGVDQQVQPLIVADQAEKEQRAEAGLERERGLRGSLVLLLPEMVVHRMRPLDDPGVRTEAPDIGGHGIAHRHEQVVLPEEPPGQRLVEEFRLVRNGIVDDGDAFDTTTTQGRRHASEGGGKERHPVAEHHDIRLPAQDLPGCPSPGERVDAVEDAGALHRHGLVLFRHVLRLARKEKIRILS